VDLPPRAFRPGTAPSRLQRPSYYSSGSAAFCLSAGGAENKELDAGTTLPTAHPSKAIAAAPSRKVAAIALICTTVYQVIPKQEVG
jgi:hypothetical protein